MIIPVEFVTMAQITASAALVLVIELYSCCDLAVILSLMVLMSKFAFCLFKVCEALPVLGRLGNRGWFPPIKTRLISHHCYLKRFWIADHC